MEQFKYRICKLLALLMLINLVLNPISIFADEIEKNSGESVDAPMGITLSKSTTNSPIVLEEEENSTSSTIDFNQDINSTTGGAIKLLLKPEIISREEKKSIIIEWNEMNGTEGYEIEIDGEIFFVGNETRFTHENIEVGETHQYRVRAIIEGLRGEWSVLLKVNKNTGDIENPKTLYSVADDKSITMIWNNVSSAEEYEVEIDGKIVETVKNNMFVHEDLKSNSKHVYKIRSKNNLMKSSWTDPIEKKVQESNLKSMVKNEVDYGIGLPENINAVTSMIIEWGEVSGATGYEIEIDGEIVAIGNNTKYEHRNLEAGESYIYRIRAVRNEKKGNWSEYIEKTVGVYEIQPPKFLEVVTKENSIYLRWNPLEKITSYELEVDGKIINLGKKFQYEHKGLQWGTKHVYRIRALKNNVSGQWSAIREINTNLKTIGNINVISDETSIILSWESIVDAEGYDVEVDGKVIDNGKNELFLSENLSPGTVHNYRIRVRKNGISGEWSSIVLGQTKLGIPRDINYEPKPSEINLIWSPIKGADAYDIEVDGVVISNGQDVSFKHLDLTPGTKHSYRIRGKRGDILGEWSRNIELYTSIIGIPKNTKISNEEGRILVKWNEVLYATGYDVEVDGVVKNVGYELRFTHEVLNPNSDHTYRVRAKIGRINGKWSKVLRCINEVDNESVSIRTIEDLNSIRENLSGKYILMKDIDMSGLNWSPIGTSTNPFIGQIEGNGFVIRNLNVDKPSISGVGLIGVARGSVISNLQIENLNIKANSNGAGLIGISKGDNQIRNCSIVGSGTIAGSDSIGGLVGLLQGTDQIESCFIDGDIVITGSRYVGGLIGNAESINISRSYVNIKSILGRNSAIGGMIGYSKFGTVNESYFAGNVESTSSEVGGLIGKVGSDDERFEIGNCFVLGNVKSNSSYVGGVVGRATRVNIYKTYVAGDISGSNNIGGIIGSKDSGEISNCYYDKRLCKSFISNKGGIGKSTNALKIKSTFRMWNFTNVWIIDEEKSYPYLSNVQVPDDVLKRMNTVSVINGTGTKENPYIIDSKEGIYSVKNDLNAFYKLVKDIDLENNDFIPIGTSQEPFMGEFDGNGHTISNIRINQGVNNDVGFFGSISNAKITNLNIENIYSNGKNNIGGLVGSSRGNNTISNCTLFGEVRINGADYIGGILGRGFEADSIIYTNIKGDIRLSGKRYIGGIIGGTQDGEITNSYAESNIEDGSIEKVGGLVGTATKITINQSYAVGDIKASGSYIGGLVGYSGSSDDSNDQVIINDSFAIEDMGYNKGSYRGGLVGYGYRSYVTNSYSASKIKGDYSVDGIVGYRRYGETKNSFYDGIVFGNIPNFKSNNIKLTNFMIKKENYKKWDFEGVWNIEEDKTYPYLRSLEKSGSVLVNTDLGKGMGTIESPYEITNREQLEYIRYIPDGNFKLMNNIDMRNENWMPIGNRNIPFTGTLDGNGFEIFNLKINYSTQDYIGLFGVIEDSKIKNLKIKTFDISGDEYVGSIAGKSLGKNLISNCELAGESKLKANRYLGGIIGMVNGDDKIQNCRINNGVTVEGNSYTGGIVGKMEKGNIIRSYVKANILSGAQSGGIVGEMITGSLEECYSTATITATASNIGGLIGVAGDGRSKRVVIDNSYSSVEINTSYTSGAMVGYGSCVTIKRSYSISRVNGYSQATGLVGLSNTLSISDVFFDSDIAGVLNPSNYAKTTNEIKTQKPYKNWDFENTWIINDGEIYPRLRQMIINDESIIKESIKIKTVQDLINIDNNLEGNYELVNDIDLNGVNWKAIGGQYNPFKGRFVGNGHKIKNLYINRNSESCVGLFASINGAEVRDIKFDNAQINGRNYVGVVAGYIKSNSSVVDISIVNNSRVTGADKVGGIAGRIEDNGYLFNIAISKGTSVSGNQYVGGVCGIISKSTVRRAYSEADINGKIRLGGIAGSGYSSKIEQCYSTGNLTGETMIGGLVGDYQNESSVMNNCYALGEITSLKEKAGGLIGDGNQGNIMNSYSACIINGKSKVGGIKGGESSFNIQNSYFDGVVSNIRDVNGFGKSLNTRNMIKKESYNNWDFNNVWDIEEGMTYPYLRRMKKPDEVRVNETSTPIQKGSGSKEDPYIIMTKKEFNNIRYEIDAFYKLGADIDMVGETWVPVGTMNNPFTGTLDGNNHKVKNFNIIEEYKPAGIFAYADGATVVNLELNNINVTGFNNVGALIGYYADDIRIENCSLTGKSRIMGRSIVGGLVGVLMENGYINLCRVDNEVIIQGTERVGGIAGRFSGAEIVNSYSKGKIIGGINVGGIVGRLTDGKLSRCYFTGEVKAAANGGGIAGESFVTIENTFAIGKISLNKEESGSKTGFGGITGSLVNDGKIINSYTSIEMDIDSASYVGGIIGKRSSGTVSNSYYEGSKLKGIRLNEFGMSRLPNSLVKLRTYNNWDFSGIWEISENQTYPYIKMLGKPDFMSEGSLIENVMDGKGTEEEPYLISKKQHLENIKFELDANYKLIKDIDLNGDSWSPIGDIKKPFMGKLNGNGHRILNLNVSNLEYGGLFGVLKDAEIINTSIENLTMNNSERTGGIAAYITNGTKIYNCHIIGETRINGKYYVGGIIGFAEEDASITYCSVGKNTMINGQSNIGGIVGKIVNSKLISCYSLAEVKNTKESLGGIAGNSSNSIIKKSYAESKVRGAKNIGGLVGYMSGDKSILEDSFVLGKVEGTTENVGGMVGYLDYGKIERCYSAAEIIGVRRVDPIIGYYYHGEVEHLYYDGFRTGIYSISNIGTSELVEKMNLVETYEGWNFTDIWGLDADSIYPYLKDIEKPMNMEEYIPKYEKMSGFGSKEDPFKIETASQLSRIRHGLKYDYELVNNIDLQGVKWMNVGRTNAPFTGTINGKNHKISNLTIQDSSREYAAFISAVENAVIQDIEFQNINIVGKNKVAGVIGNNTGETLIKGCRLTGKNNISGQFYVSGIAAYDERGLRIENCSVNEGTNISGTRYISGIVGLIREGEVQNTYSRATINASDQQVGGIAGSALDSKIKQCYSAGQITGKTRIGGLVGYIGGRKGLIENSYALGKVVVNENYGGGIVGYVHQATIRNSYAAVDLKKGYYMNGIVGKLSEGIVENSYFDNSKHNQNTPGDQSKTKAEMFTKTTYKGWDFDNIWIIEDGKSYPQLNMISSPVMINMDSNGADFINISWNIIPEIDSYELSVDGVNVMVNGNRFNHTSLVPGSVHKYKVRSVKNGRKSEWSSELQAITKFETIEPMAVVNDNNIVVSWNGIKNVDSYDVQIDGGEIITVTDRRYIHTITEKNVYHYYRIRGKNSNGVGDWSDIVDGLSWKSGQAVALTFDNWDESKKNRYSTQNVVIKGHEFSDIYSIEIELTCDENSVELMEKELTKVFGGTSETYLGYYKKGNTFKAIISLEKIRKGISGEVNLLDIKFNVKEGNSFVKLKSIKAVNSKGEFVDIEKAKDLQINKL